MSDTDADADADARHGRETAREYGARVTVRLDDGVREELAALVDAGVYESESAAVRAAVDQFLASVSADVVDDEGGGGHNDEEIVADGGVASEPQIGVCSSCGRTRPLVDGECTDCAGGDEDVR